MIKSIYSLLLLILLCSAVNHVDADVQIENRTVTAYDMADTGLFAVAYHTFDETTNDSSEFGLLVYEDEVEIAKILDVHSEHISSIVWLDNNMLATGSFDKTVKILTVGDEGIEVEKEFLLNMPVFAMETLDNNLVAVSTISTETSVLADNYTLTTKYSLFFRDQYHLLYQHSTIPCGDLPTTLLDQNS